MHIALCFYSLCNMTVNLPFPIVGAALKVPALIVAVIVTGEEPDTIVSAPHVVYAFLLVSVIINVDGMVAVPNEGAVVVPVDVMRRAFSVSLLNVSVDKSTIKVHDNA